MERFASDCNRIRLERSSSFFGARDLGRDFAKKKPGDFAGFRQLGPIERWEEPPSRNEQTLVDSARKDLHLIL
jgi:hypothetical protein